MLTRSNSNSTGLIVGCFAGFCLVTVLQFPLRAPASRIHAQDTRNSGASSATLQAEIRACRDAIAKDRTAAVLTAQFERLESRYQADPRALSRILVAKSDAYRDFLQDRAAAVVAAGQAAEALELALADLAVDRLRLLQLRGELAQVTGKPADAMVFYREVLAVPIIDRPYFLRINELQPLYLQSAEKLLSVASDQELSRIYVPPFARTVLEERQPRQAAKLSRVEPSRIDFEEKALRWLNLIKREYPRDDPMQTHVDAVLRYAEQHH